MNQISSRSVVLTTSVHEVNRRTQSRSNKSLAKACVSDNRHNDGMHRGVGVESIAIANRERIHEVNLDEPRMSFRQVGAARSMECNETSRMAEALRRRGWIMVLPLPVVDLGRCHRTEEQLFRCIVKSKRQEHSHPLNTGLSPRKQRTAASTRCRPISSSA
ncbi:uncharacterized protein B0H18DRAFT_446669 [Fomitopsis serialis]|uniref:uncharacterized protein n=1 Tax=Fomitopsis serialis TaxID=139415 RepID=UPI0020075165|nr:uncharacterized protein B0H18DRAFT_446669 [Neoantrodia serialis]KAH9910601.1 hypothetical protein B0H18DRAFT_446669 [Neoantrodia serialis]